MNKFIKLFFKAIEPPSFGPLSRYSMAELEVIVVMTNDGESIGRAFDLVNSARSDA